jgi:hypothetical protein
MRMKLMDFDATAASTLQQAPTIPLKLLLVSMRQPPASLHAHGIERRSWPSAAARAGRARGRRPWQGGARPCQAPPWRIHPRKKHQQQPSQLVMEDLIQGVRLDIARNPSGQLFSAAPS